MPKIVHFGEFLSVTRQVNFSRPKIGKKCQNKKKSNETFGVFFKQREWVLRDHLHLISKLKNVL